MIVVDVNTIAYLWIPGEMTTLAEHVLAQDAHWVSVILWRSEFRNILAGYLRRGQLNRLTVDRCLNAAENQLARHEYLVPSDRVMRLVEQSECSAYDCEYVALAQDLNVPLITSDKAIIRAFPSLAISPKSFCNK
jgi:predicted nucleic acid-binding protein